MQKWPSCHFTGYCHSDTTVIAFLQPGVINTRMIWRGKPKKQVTFFVGTSPEFDISIYTLCLLARTNKECNVEINQYKVPIKTFDVDHVPGLQIGSAFPSMDVEDRR